MKTPTKTPTVRKRYSNSQIAFALEELRRSEYNFYQTAKKVGVSRSTLIRWRKEFQVAPLVTEENEESAPIEVAEVIQSVDDNIQELDEAITLAIKKAKSLIPMCKTAIEASTVAKNLTKVRLDLTGKDLDEDKKNKGYSILQATINILNKNNQ